LSRRFCIDCYEVDCVLAGGRGEGGHEALRFAVSKVWLSPTTGTGVVIQYDTSAQPSKSCHSSKMDWMFPAGHLRHSDLKLGVDRKVRQSCGLTWRLRIQSMVA